MLFGKYLCRHHERTLQLIFCRRITYRSRNSSLSAANVTLYQPIHRTSAFHHILNAALNDSFLCICRRIGKIGAELFGKVLFDRIGMGHQPITALQSNAKL